MCRRVITLLFFTSNLLFFSARLCWDYRYASYPWCTGSGCHAYPVHLSWPLWALLFAFSGSYHLLNSLSALQFSRTTSRTLAGTYCALFTNAHSTRDPARYFVYIFFLVFFTRSSFRPYLFPSTSDYCPLLGPSDSILEHGPSLR